MQGTLLVLIIYNYIQLEKKIVMPKAKKLSSTPTLQRSAPEQKAYDLETKYIVLAYCLPRPNFLFYFTPCLKYFKASE